MSILFFWNLFHFLRPLPVRHVPLPFSLFFSLGGVFSWNYGGVFEGRDPQTCTFGKPAAACANLPQPTRWNTGGRTSWTQNFFFECRTRKGFSSGNNCFFRGGSRGSAWTPQVAMLSSVAPCNNGTSCTARTRLSKPFLQSVET